MGSIPLDKTFTGSDETRTEQFRMQQRNKRRRGFTCLICGKKKLLSSKIVGIQVCKSCGSSSFRGWKANPTRLNRLSAVNRMTNCRCCGKRTHSSIEGAIGVELCLVCYDSAGFENEHNDGGHEPGSKPEDCATCAGVDCMHELVGKKSNPKKKIDCPYCGREETWDGKRCDSDDCPSRHPGKRNPAPRCPCGHAFTEYFEPGDRVKCPSCKRMLKAVPAGIRNPGKKNNPHHPHYGKHFIVNTGLGTINPKNPYKNEFIEGWKKDIEDNKEYFVLAHSTRSNSGKQKVFASFGDPSDQQERMGDAVNLVHSQTNREFDTVIIEGVYRLDELVKHMKSPATLYSFD